MSPGPTTRSRWVPTLVYGLPLLIYCAVVLPLGLRQRELMNADAMCYIRRAQYLLHGQFYFFISEHWSLLLSWLIAPLMAARVDGLYAARIVLGCVGGLYMICFSLLAQRLLKVHWLWHCLAGVILAPLVAALAMRSITPDLLLATLLVIYFLMVLHPDLLKSRRRQFLAGLVGGLAYLSKSFALPFFLAHLLMTLLVKRFSESPQEEGIAPPHSPLKNLSLAYARALLGFLLIAGPWIGALSLKYHHLTFGSAGAAAHGMLGPPDTLGKQDSILHAYLEIPPGPYVSPFENPEHLYPRWSPFASRQNFHWQLSIIRSHAVDLVNFLSLMAPPHVIPALMLLSLALLLIRSPQRWKIGWLLLTLFLFLAPFLLVLITYRYLIPHIVPLTMLLCLMVVLEWRRWAESPQGPTPKPSPLPRVRFATALLMCASFAWGGYQWIRPMLGGHGSDVYRKLAGRINREGLKGPFACEDRTHGAEIAYHSGHKYAGFPNTENPQEATLRLHQIGVEYLVNLNSRKSAGAGAGSCAALMVERGGWRQVVRFRGTAVYRYDPAAPPTSRPATREVMPADEPLDDAEVGNDDPPPAAARTPAKSKKVRRTP